MMNNPKKVSGDWAKGKENVGVRLFYVLLLLACGVLDAQTPADIFHFDSSSKALITYCGMIGKISKLPDCATMSYADCLFSAEFHVKGQKIILLFPGIKDRKLVHYENFPCKDMSYVVQVLPWDELPESFRTIQIADQLDDFSSPIFYVMKIDRKKEEAKDQPVPQVSKSLFSELKIHKAPENPVAKKLRRQRIQTETARINQCLQEHGGSFPAWYQEISKISFPRKSREEIVQGTLFYLPPNVSGLIPDKLDKKNCALTGLKALNDFLKQYNIDLIVVFFPEYWEVAAAVFYPDLMPKDKIIDVRRMNLIYELLQSDIEAVDMLPAISQEKFTYPPLLFQAHLQDGHPSEGAAKIAAHELAGVLSRYAFPPQLAPQAFSLQKHAMRSGREYGKYQEDAILVHGKPISLAFKEAPYMIIGDSFSYHPQSFSSTVAYLAMKTGIVPTYTGRTAGATSIFREMLRLHMGHDILNKVKVVVTITMPSFFYKPWDIPSDVIVNNIQAVYSQENKFHGIIASVAGKPIEFGPGFYEEKQEPASKKSVPLIVLTIPEVRPAPECLIIQYANRGILSFLSVQDATHRELQKYDLPNNEGGETLRFTLPSQLQQPLQLEFPPGIHIIKITLGSSK